MSCNCGTRTCTICTPGPQGPVGDTGATGATGAPGPQGIAGPTGAAGANGTNGTNGFGYDATSGTNTNILDTGATTLSAVISIDKAYLPGSRVRFAHTLSPSVNYFEGVVDTYDSGTGAMDIIAIDVKNGTGTIDSWNVSIGGEKGDTGATGATGLQGPQGLVGATGPAGAAGAAGDDGFGYNATSAVSTDILDTGVTTLSGSMSVDKAYTVGARVRFSDQASPSVNFFEGIVDAYTPSTGAFTIDPVDYKAGSGTISAWNINLAGENSSASVTVATAIDYTPNNREVVLVDATSGVITIDLKAAASSVDNVITVKKIDVSANTVTLDGDGSETIDGATTNVLSSQYDSVTIICDGTDWHVI